jgi:hypothetical protein
VAPSPPHQLRNLLSSRFRPRLIRDLPFGGSTIELKGFLAFSFSSVHPWTRRLSAVCRAVSILIASAPPASSVQKP